MLAHGVVSCGDKSVLVPCHLFNHCLSAPQYAPAHWTAEHRTQPVNQVTAFARNRGRYQIHSHITSLFKLYSLCGMFESVFWSQYCSHYCAKILTSSVKSDDATRWRRVVGIHAWTTCAKSNSCHFRILVICPVFFLVGSHLLCQLLYFENIWNCSKKPLMFYIQNFVDCGVQTTLTVL